MFTILFAAIGQLLFWVSVGYIAYRLVFNKSIKAKKELKVQKENAEKLALIILKSNSSKEVSDFMTKNVSFLSKETFSNLSEHLDYLKVMNDEPLKTRIENLSNVVEDYDLQDSTEVALEPIKSSK